MRQRPQYITEAFARSGHPTYFVDPREPEARVVGDVTIVPSIADTPRSHVILYVHFAPVRTLFERYDDPVVVYDILDDLSIYDPDEVGMPPERRVRYHHGPVIAAADVVVASAPALIETHSVEREDMLMIENGVDPAAFSARRDRPADLPATDGSIIGYHGMIARWFDFAMVAGIADELRSDVILLVGPVDPEVAKPLAALTARPNVVHVGSRPSNEIAAYVQAFDVGLVPFVVDDLTRAVSPLKMYEYMAAGVPVVAAPLPVCVDHPAVATAATPHAAVDAVRAALAMKSDPAQVEMLTRAALDASWDRRIEPILERLDDASLRYVPS
jgi:glycosyltransferase involved in cell wall biosynthesis